MNKKYIFLFIALILLPSKALAEEICVNGNRYDVVSAGANVNVQEIEKENIERESMLPKEYFRMKTALSYSGITTSQIDEYLDDAEDGFNTGNTNYWVREFLRQYGTTYKKYSSVLKNGTEADYAIKVTPLNVKCNRRFDKNGHYTILSCPTSEQYSSRGKYNTIQFQKAIGTFEFNGRGKFNVKMTDLFDQTLLVRVVKNGTSNSQDYDYDSVRKIGWVGSNDLIYELNSGGITMTFDKGEEVRLEFYIRPSAGITCSGAYVGYTTFTAPEYAYVANPYLEHQVCKNFKNGYSHIPTTPTNYKEIFVPECYKSELEYFTELNKVSDSLIQNKINKISSLLATDTADISNLQCHYHTDNSLELATQTKTFIYNPASSNSEFGDYWAASCTETVTVVYDQPKQVISGTGFTYQASLKVERKCTPTVINVVPKPTQCSYNIECWGGPANHTGEAGAGPNEEFDSCVQACDGGVYTKDCINSCYSAVYEKNIDRTFSFLDVVKQKQTLQEDNDSEILAVANTFDCSKRKTNSPNYCYNQNKSWWYKNKIVTNKNQYKPNGLVTALGSPIYELAATSNNQSNCNGSTSCTSFHGRTFTYLNGCNSSSNPTLCYEVYSSVPRPNCSDNPNEDYKTLKIIAEEEYEALLAAIKTYENSEDVTMSVIDTYKTQAGNKNKFLETTWNDEVKFEGGVEEAKIVENVRIETYAVDNSSKNVPEVTVTKAYTANLPQAYINAITGDEKYVNSNYQADSDERDGGNKYYTDINSKTYNDFRTWYDGYAPTKNNYNPSVRVGNNIGVTFKNVGTKQTNGRQGYTWNKIDIDCFYGLYNQHHIECEDGVCDLICNDEDVCTGGLQYMFRQVNLPDLFPDRNPRWNWTYKTQVGSTQTGYISDPSKIIEDIEKTGNNAYSHEPEYEFVITGGNINRIREYNDRAGSYQEYPDMTCSTSGSGAKVCKSGLMTNTTYVKSFRRNTTLGENTNKNG